VIETGFRHLLKLDAQPDAHAQKQRPREAGALSGESVRVRDAKEGLPQTLPITYRVRS
jgi:hypothetical protein